MGFELCHIATKIGNCVTNNCVTLAKEKKMEGPIYTRSSNHTRVTQLNNNIYIIYIYLKSLSFHINNCVTKCM